MSNKSDHLLSARLKNVSLDVQLKTKRQFRGPSTVGHHVKPVMTAVGNKFGFGKAYILENWEEIIGPDLAKHIYPERLLSSKPGHGILHVRVPGGLAVQVQHHIPQILERINRHYGYEAATHVKLIQGPLPQRDGAFASPWGNAQPAKRSVDEGTESLVSEVKNPQVRRQLERIQKRLARSRRTKG